MRKVVSVDAGGQNDGNFIIGKTGLLPEVGAKKMRSRLEGSHFLQCLHELLALRLSNRELPGFDFSEDTGDNLVHVVTSAANSQKIAELILEPVYVNSLF